jgi:geranylgeranyl diphosphate synthase type I
MIDELMAPAIDEVIDEVSTLELLDWAREAIAPLLRRVTESLCPGMSLVTGYQHGWIDRHGAPVTGGSGGKALRPALALLSAEAAGAPPRSGVPAAAAVELVHNFSLLHDDVMDGDTERRHRPTAWSVFGVGPAILGGDAVLTAAFDVLLETGRPTAVHAARRVVSTTQLLIAGQSADLDFEKHADVTLEECLTMVANKTAALLSCAASLGAVLVGGPPQLIAGLSLFGWHLGMAFQLVDDILGIWGDPRVTGKPAMEDLRSRKKSVPVVAALHSGSPAADRLLAFYRRQEPPTTSELPQMARLVEECGGRWFTEDRAAQEIGTARQTLAALGLPPLTTLKLEALASIVVRRDN